MGYSRPDTRAVNMLPLIALSLLASVMAQNLQCPTGVTNPNTFYIIGASGGDSTTACENTAAATTAGLLAGMNAVELDVSVSQDKVVFLWNDPKPTDPVAQARSQGLFVNGMCRPAFNTILGTRDIVFSQIRKDYIYLNSSKTNNVLGVWQLRQNQLLNHIQCCMEDKMTPCLS